MITLKLRTDVFNNSELGAYISHGVDVYENNILVQSIPDVSLNLSEVSRFVELCNISDVSYVHLHDLIDDFFFT